MLTKNVGFIIKFNFYIVVCMRPCGYNQIKSQTPVCNAYYAYIIKSYIYEQLFVVVTFMLKMHRNDKFNLAIKVKSILYFVAHVFKAVADFELFSGGGGP